MPLGLFKYNRMPFGLSYAPHTFQHLIERCLGDFNFETVLVYLDDIIIFFKLFEDHIQHLDRVFTRLPSMGKSLNPVRAALCARKSNSCGTLWKQLGFPWV